MPDGKRFIRLDSLGENYSESALQERISGKRIVAPKQKYVAPVAPQKPNLLIDIQAKMQQGYGEGFRQWASTQNLKTMSKILIFLQEHDITDVDSLTEKAAAASKRFNDNGDRRKFIESRLAEITALQKHIGVYGKTLDVYRQYRDDGWDKKFYAQHESDITIHKAAKNLVPCYPAIVIFAEKSSGALIDQHFLDPDEDMKDVFFALLLGYIDNVGRPTRLFIRSYRVEPYVRFICYKLKIELLCDEVLPCIDKFFDEVLGSGMWQ